MFLAFLPYKTSSVNNDVRKVWRQIETDQLNLKDGMPNVCEVPFG